MDSTRQNNNNLVKISVLCLLVFAFQICASAADKIHARKTVETHDGMVRGRLNHTLFRKIDFYSFLGIPYAEKPLNDLRFKVRYHKVNHRNQIVHHVCFHLVVSYQQ